MSINRVYVSGNLGRDSELRVTQSGTAILSFTLAVNDRKKQQDGSWGDYTNWVDCTLFGNRAEALQPYLTKGVKVSVDGALRYSSWQQKDGSRRSKLEVVVNEVELMAYRRDRQQPTGMADAQAVVQDAFPGAQVSYEPADVYGEDIPF